jgi:hypothetical protein
MYNVINYSELFKPEEILDYLRKSQSDDPLLTVEEVLQKHETILDEWDEKHLGAKVPEENRFREVVSGETIKERPEINKVLRLIESPRYKAVKVVEPQRLTRGDLEDIGRLMKLFKHTNTYVITPERMYDLRDEYDWNAFEAELKRGNDYLKYTKKILSRGKYLSAASGNYIFSIPPYGFDKTFVMDGKKKCPTLKENPEQANIVRMIFDWYANEGIGRTAICYRLDELGVKPPKGEEWAPTAVREMLRNVHYIGKIKINSRCTVTVVEDGEFIKKRPQTNIEEQLIYEGKHSAIVPQELFDKVQERLGRNHRATTRVKLRNPFASLMFCKTCGRAMVLQAAQTKCAPRICCSKQSRCGTGSCTYDEIVNQISTILEQCIEDFEMRIKSNKGDALKLHNELIKNLENKMKELQAREIAQWDAQTNPDPAKRMPQEIFQQLNEKLLHEKDEIQQALCNAYESMPEPIDYKERVTRFSNALEALNNPETENVEKNELLKACFERIEYYREKPQRISLKGKGTFPMTATKWTNPAIELDVKLKV